MINVFAKMLTFLLLNSTLPFVIDEFFVIDA